MPDLFSRSTLSAVTMAAFFGGLIACASAAPGSPAKADAPASGPAVALVDPGDAAGDDGVTDGTAKSPEDILAEAIKEWDITDPPGDWGWSDVDIDTTEGTWISLDISPDGSTIVFDLLGDIYTIPARGGDATPIRTGLDWSMQPRFSPDGTEIAFTTDAGDGDNIWIMNADGSDARQITEESFRLVNNPAWAPSGRYVVAKKHFTSKRSLGAGEMWMYHTGGGAAGVQMTKRPNEQKDVNDPAFSPDGKYLYYDRDATPGRSFQYNKDSSGQIFVIERLELETGEIKRIAGGPGGAVRPTPSPDGKRLAFIRRVDYVTTLFVKDLESGEERPIMSGLDRDNQEAWSLHGLYPAMAWSPDSASVYLWSGGKIRRVDIDSEHVATIPFRVRTTMRVARAVRSAQPVAPDSLDVKMLRSVVVSPDGDRVAYVALGHVWVKTLPDGEPRRLTSFDDRFEHTPSFSRDGKSIVFCTWDDRDLGAIRIAPATGGDGRAVTTEPGHYVDPVFSPDGQTVVFRRVGAGYLRSPLYSDETGVFRINARGGKAELIRKGGSGAHFGARNDRLYLMVADGDETSDTRMLVAYDLDKRTERTLMTSDAVQAWRVSPDGKWLAFREGFNVYITPLVETGRTITIGAKAKGLPVAKATKEAGDNLSWSGDSSSLHWSLGPELFTRELADSFAFLDGAPEELPEPPAEGVAIGFSTTPDTPEGVVALTNARIITMRGDEVIDNGAVVIDGNKIVAVGAMDEVLIPSGATVIDSAGKTIMPGIIDAHAHGPQGTSGIIPQHNWSQYANLAFGVTTIHDPSNDTATIFSASEMQRAGLIRAPRIFSTGTILYGAAGAGYHAEINSLDDALFHLKRMQAVGAFSVKSYNQPRRDQRQQVLEAARQLGMLVVPEGGSTLMANLTMVVDGHTTVEHNIPVETLYDDILQLWQASETANTPTLVVCYGGISGENYWYQHMDVWKHEALTRFVPHYVVDPRSRRRTKAPEGDYNHIRISQSVKKLFDRGVLINTGAHGQLAGLAAHWEMWMLAQGGMSPMEVLRCATMNPATTLGLDNEIGSIEPGKLADLVVLDANPLENIRNTDSVRSVMCNGRLYDARTMNQIGAHTDTVGSDAFGDGPNSVGVGQWWGVSESAAHTHVGCSCGAGN